MSVFDDVPAEDDAFSQAAGAMYEQQFTDDDFNALVERVSTGDVDPHNPLHAVLREVRYQLRAQPPVQIGTELGEFIGVGPASDARYTDFERPGMALVKYEPTIALDGTVNEIILEPLPEPASRLQRSGMMLAAAALVAVAMIAGAGISRSLNPTDSIPIDVEAPAVFGNEGPGANVPAATAVVAPVADESPEAESDTLADTAEIVEPEPAVEDAPVEADEVNIALVSSEDEVTSIDTVDASQDDSSAEDADLANPGARDTRNVAPEPTIAPPTVVPPTATPEPTPVPAEPAPQVVPVIVAPTATPIPAPTSTTVPTATATPRPTATNTPVPTATSTPTPAPTSTTVPTATATPRPTATNTPVPTATSTPPTSTPVPPPPAATSTPVPPPTPIGD